MKVGFFTVALFVCCLSPTAFAQQAKLEGYVFDEKDNRVRGVRLVAPGGQAAETDSRGHFTLLFPSTVEPGQATRIELARPGWVIYEPMMGNCVTQSTARNYEPLKVVIVPRGSPLALSPRRLARVIAQWADERARLRGQLSRYRSQLDEYAFLREYAKKYGFTLGRVLEAAQLWAQTKDASDQEEQALKEYVQKHYDRAAYLAHESALAAAAELDRANEHRTEAGRKVVRRFKLAGNAFFEQNKFRETLAAYKEVDRRFTLRNLSKEDLIQEWAEIKFLIGIAKRELGTRVEGQEGQQLLSESVTEYRHALTVFTREQMLEEWAATQNSLAVTLMEQSERLEGEAGARLQAQAAEAFRAALQVFTREHQPEDWAGAQNNLGNTLVLLGERLEGEERAQLLSQAVEAYRAALTVFTRGHMPQLWAMTQNNLGIALREQGDRIGGEAGMRLLAQAADAHRAALQIRTREHLPEDWAVTQNNLGSTLASQGRRLEGEESVRLLAQAAEAYRAALQVSTRTHLPQQWAMTQYNLGITLMEQSEQLGGHEAVGLLSQAAEAFRAALQVFTHEHLPPQWAVTQAGLGVALFSQGTRLGGEEGARLLAQAAEAFRAALQVHTREHVPQRWAFLQNNLARTYAQLRNWPDAAEAYSNVLMIYPDNEDAYSLAVGIYHELLFKFDEAFELSRRWLARHPDDPWAQADFAEMHFTMGRFADCVRRINALLPKQGLDTSTRITMRVIEIASLLALEQNNQVKDKIEALLEEVSRQPADFKLGRGFEGARHFVGRDERLSPYRDWLRQLFDALVDNDRDTILNGLRRTAANFKE